MPGSASCPRDSRTGDDTVWIDVDPFYAFHFMNAWEDESGSIIVDGCRAAAMPIAFGDDPPPDSDVRPYLWRWEIDPTAGVVKDTQLHDQPGDFPRINESRSGLPYRFGTHAHSRKWGDRGIEFDGVIQFDHQTGTRATHVYGPTHVSGEAVFAPDPSGRAENDGWLLNFVTDLAEGSSEFVVLDARDVSAGPVARVQATPQCAVRIPRQLDARQHVLPLFGRNRRSTRGRRSASVPRHGRAVEQGQCFSGTS